jgi:hypothetical protein
MGGVFLQSGKFQPHPDPSRMIGADGDLTGLYLQHGTLVADVNTALWRSWKDLPAGLPQAWGHFDFLPEDQSVSITQAADLRNELGVKADVVALGLLRFTLFCNEHLQPRYAWVDELGDNSPSDESVSAGRLEYLFWTNLFDPQFSLTLGRDFFDEVPGGTVVHLDNGGVLYLATDSFSDWRENDHPEILAHFRHKFPSVQAYRARFYPT